MKKFTVVLIFTLLISCSSSKDNYFYYHYYGNLAEYTENLNFKTSNFIFRFSTSNYYSKFSVKYYFFKDSLNIYYKKYDFVNELISIRKIDSIIYNEVELSLNWLKNYTYHFERDSYSFDNDFDCGMEYQILLNDNNKHKIALIYNKSDSKDQGKEHDYSIMLIKSLILEAELFPELYDKVINMEDVFPTDSIYKEYKKRWE